MFWFVQSNQMVVEYMDGESCYPKHDEARTETEIFDLSLNVSLRKHFGIFGDPSDTYSITFFILRHFYLFFYLFISIFVHLFHFSLFITYSNIVKGGLKLSDFLNSYYSATLLFK